MPSRFAFASAGASDVGRVRLNNEDACFADDTVLVVADGVGGRPAGEVASTVAVTTARLLVGAGASPVDAAHGATEAVAALSPVNPLFTGMCCTLTIAAIDGAGTVQVAHVGDSRGYVLVGSSGELRQMTYDHTVANRLVAEGRLTAEEAAADPRANTIYMVIGKAEIDPWVVELDGDAGDRLLLCSDGVSGVLDDDQLRKHLAAGAPPADTAASLVAAALDAGSTDNCTAVVADIVES